MGCRTRRRTDCGRVDRRHRVQRLCLRPGLRRLRLLWWLCAGLLRGLRRRVLRRVRPGLRLCPGLLWRIHLELLRPGLLSPGPARDPTRLRLLRRTTVLRSTVLRRRTSVLSRVSRVIARRKQHTDKGRRDFCDLFCVQRRSLNTENPGNTWPLLPECTSLTLGSPRYLGYSRISSAF